VTQNDYFTETPAPDELRLRHLTVDEALPLLDEFLHDRFVRDFRTVRVIHGKGTGTLRETVRRVLKGHPLVKSFRAGGHAEGKQGVTIVEFSEH